MAALLQSPSFLFREEVGEVGDYGVRRATSVELASRLAFLLWDSVPDDELLTAAEAGELDTDAGLRGEADRLLPTPAPATASGRSSPTSSTCASSTRCRRTRSSSRT